MRMNTSNVNLFRRYDRAQEQMILAVMPNSGVVEYDELIQRVPRTGKIWSLGRVRRDA